MTTCRQTNNGGYTKNKGADSHFWLAHQILFAYNHYVTSWFLTVASGLHMALTNARDAFVADLMVSVLPYLYQRVDALSYVAVR